MSLTQAETKAVALSTMKRGVFLRTDVAHALGVYAALFFSQLWFHQIEKDAELGDAPKTKDGGWVWKTRDEWYEETALTYNQQETARTILKENGLLEEKEDRLKHRMFYKLTPNKAHAFLAELSLSSRKQKRTRRGGQKELAGEGKKNSPSIYESTSYNTSYIIPATPECSSSESPDSSTPPIPTPPLEHSSTPLSVELPPPSGAAAPPFDSDEYIDDMMDPDKEKNKAVRLIGNYLFYLGDQYPSAKAIGSVIRQNVRLANTIVEEGWTEEEIEGLMEELANDSFWKNKHWTLKRFKDLLPKFRADLTAKKNQKIVRHL